MAAGLRCCGCYTKGRRMSCSCAKSAKQCVNCRPSSVGHCENPGNSPVVSRRMVRWRTSGGAGLRSERLVLSDGDQSSSGESSQDNAEPPSVLLESVVQLVVSRHLRDRVVGFPSHRCVLTQCSFGERKMRRRW